MGNNRKGFNFHMIIVLLIISFSCQDKMPTADLIITNAKIWTGNSDQPLAKAFAVCGDTIIAVGSIKEIQKFEGERTKVLNLNEKFVVPGFIDSHVHFLTGGFNLSSVQLRDADTKEEFIRRISEFAKKVKPGTWILGGDWDHTLWGGALPEKDWIDNFTQNNPVFVTRLDGHMSLANTLAMKLAGINEDIQDIVGGTIVRNSSGKLSGIFKENAASLIEDKIPSPSDEQTDIALIKAMNFVASNGVTSVHHMGGNMDALERARDNHSLITRIYAMVPLADWKVLKEKTTKYGNGDKWLKIGGLKGFVDGSLGSRTAAFLSPYSDSPSDSGFFVNTKDDLYNWTLNGDKEGLQVMIHAIGDRAVRYLLNMYDSVAKENGPRDRRFRIEHAQHISPEDIARCSRSGIIPSMQPYHLIDDGRWAEKAIGPERIQAAYAFKSLFDSGATVAFGSDWFVAPPAPLEGIYSAVTRRTLDNKNPDGWVPGQKISVEQALMAYTKNGAYASFEEDIKGTLEPGKLADFVVISEDLTKIDPIRIPEAKILQTFVGGRKVYDINGK
jgi:predicted amidohydrolase YtcJ